MRILFLVTLTATLFAASATADYGTECHPITRCTPSGCVLTFECR